MVVTPSAGLFDLRRWEYLRSSVAALFATHEVAADPGLGMALKRGALGGRDERWCYANQLERSIPSRQSCNVILTARRRGCW